MQTASRSNRRIPIPRWRDLHSVIESRELGSPLKSARPQGIKISELLERLGRWRFSPGLIESAELVETAIITGDDVDALKAAAILIEAGEAVMPLVRKNAALILERNGENHRLPRELKQSELEPSSRWRAHLRIHPRDALAWVELARLQMGEGLASKSATRSMKVALQIAPNNRHVLRTAARMYVHLGDPEMAYAIIRRNEATLHDPWLLAAEVSLATLIDKDTKYYKAVVSALDRDIQPRHLSELASALGTHLLRDGETKKSRKLFRQSMSDPNGNALAQAVWASPIIGDSLVKNVHFVSRKDVSEACARRRFWDGDFSGAFADSMKWIMEEPISSKAYVGAISAACELEDYEAAEKQVIRGLKHDPDSTELLINGAFVCACQGKLWEAERYLSLAETNATDHQKDIILADRGLIALRNGEHVEGLAYYDRAIAGFRARGMYESEKIARAYRAKEAALAKLPNAKQLFEEAQPKRAENVASNLANVLKQAGDILVRNVEAAQP